jgi:cytochrome c-type biogenesis protein CcmH
MRAARPITSMLTHLFAGWALACAATAQASAPAEDPRVQQLSSQLRCLVCQNQTVADSQAPLAQDFRRQIGVLLAQGRNEQQVIDHMVERYGDYVLYKPPFRAGTWALWLGPFLLLGLGALALVRSLARQRRESQSAVLTPEQREHVRALLKPQADSPLADTPEGGAR